MPAALLVLLLGGMLFGWIDWRRRSKRIPRLLGPFWDCPHCGILNEPDLTVCWSCGAAIARRSWHPGGTASPETWQCRQCRALNSVSRKSCWSCAQTPVTQPKRDA